MIVVVAVVAVLLLFAAAVLRAGGASLIRTPRADALRDEVEDISGAGRVAQLLEDRANVQPALGTSITFLIVAAVIPLVRDSPSP